MSLFVNLPENPRHPRILVLLSALMFSMAAPVAKYVDFGPLNLSFYRSLSGFIVLILISAGKNYQHMWRFTRYEIAGGIIYPTMSLSLFFALDNTTAANATILFQTTPVFLIPLGYYFLKERVVNRDIIAIVLMIGGIALCLREGLSIQGQKGDLFALGGALSFGAVSILMKKNKGGDNIRILILGNLIIILVTLPFQFGINPARIDIGLSTLLGLVGLAAPFMLMARSLKGLRALEVAIFRNVEAVLASLWVALIIGEYPGLWTVMGFILVTIALLVRARPHGSDTESNNEKDS